MFESPAALVTACEMIEDFEECETSITSPYDPSMPACFWDPDVDPRCAMIEPDPESWTIERIMAILICASSSRMLPHVAVCDARSSCMVSHIVGAGVGLRVMSGRCYALLCGVLCAVCREGRRLGSRCSALSCARSSCALFVVARVLSVRAPLLSHATSHRSRTGMVVIEPFVVAVEWLYMTIFNAPAARTRSPAQVIDEMTFVV